ncbi:MAG: tetratricopeptide repeat protein [Nitrospirae bacterium]|nr:tetratricopeptide repeat protein [Nitrospirota bacterium]
MKKKYLMASALLLVTSLVYWQVSGHDFISYDDPVVVYENSHVLSGLTIENISWAFTTTYFSSWYPLTWISHMLDVQLFGLSPGKHHLMNLGLHILNTSLLLLILIRMTGEFWKSLFVASLFALHPMHVESVAWIAERKDVLSTFFWLLTVWAYVKYVEQPRVWRYLFVCIYFACSLMAKPMPVTLPLVLLLFDYWPLCRIPGMHYRCRAEQEHKVYRISSQPASVSGLILEKLPLLLISASASAVTFIVQQRGEGLVSLGTVPLLLRCSNALVTYMKYIEKMLWPAELSIIYPLKKHINSSELLFAIALLFLISSIVIRFRKKIPYLPVGWLFFLITLLPVIGIIQVGDQAMADRYTYIPYTGLFIMITWGAADIAGQWQKRSSFMGVIAGIVLVLITVGTWNRLGYWKNTKELFGQAVTVAGDYFVAQKFLGIALLDEMKIDEAINHLEIAIRDKPDFAEAHYNLGNAWGKKGNTSKAIDSFGRAILFKPDFMDAYLNRAILYVRLGDYGRAEADVLRVLAFNLQPSATNHCTPEETNFLLGTIYSDTGDQEKAIEYISRAITFKPTYYAAYLKRGLVYKKAGRSADAAADFTRACQGGNSEGCMQLNALPSHVRF